MRQRLATDGLIPRQRRRGRDTAGAQGGEIEIVKHVGADVDHKRGERQQRGGRQDESQQAASQTGRRKPGTGPEGNAKGRDPDGQECQQRDMSRREGERRLNHKRGEDHQCHGKDAGQEELQDTAETTANALSFPERIRQRAEGIAQEDDVGRVARRLAAALHGDTQVRLLQTQHVVDAIASHGHIVAMATQRLDQPLLLFGCHPPEDGRALGRFAEFTVRHRLELEPRDELRIARETGLTRQRRDRLRVVSRDDFQRDSGVAEALSALSTCGRNSSVKPSQATV